MPDSLQHIITIPQYEAPDTIIDSDLEHALNARYDVDGIDLSALRIVIEPPAPPAPRWEDGLAGTPREVGIGDNSGILAIITGIFVLMMLSYRNSRRLFTTLLRELWGMRRRANVFDEHTSNESQTLVLMAMQWCVYTGLLLYSHIADICPVAESRVFLSTISVIGLMAAYYLFQLAAYTVVGFTFSDKVGQRYFVQGFTASQSLLSFLLVIPTLVAIFYPEAVSNMIIIGAWLYVLARITFIIKGFRIFYHKFSSLLYFILYLCTLEIIPLIVLYDSAFWLVTHN